MLLSFALSSH
uniref:Uncharacterized protein n=1 Tax=Arundo donax TaxID=35708 RepID=A0A0A8Y6Y9_ARUDO